MAKICIVNHAMNGGGRCVELFSTYHRDEESAAAAFEECKRSASEDPNLIELVCLDTDTMEATHITGWEGTSDDLDVLHEEEDEDDDWIVGWCSRQSISVMRDTDTDTEEVSHGNQGD